MTGVGGNDGRGQAPALKARPRGPIIPGNKADRTGAAGILRRARAEVGKRFEGLRREVLALFDGIPVYTLNDDGAAVLYGLTPEQLAGVAEELQATLDRWIAQGRDPAHLFWWDRYDDEAAHLGTAQTVANLSAVSASYAAARTLESVVYSAAYVNRQKVAKFKSYEHWTGLSATLRTELAKVIGQAVADGTNPRVARKLIEERLGVSRAKALQYAQTDITDTLRMARVAEAEHAQERMGLKLMLLWTSALLPTTRPHHASRHGRAYTPQEVRDFYASGGEIFNCHCATTEAMLDDAGQPIMTDRARESMKSELQAWERSQLDA